jgi:2-polyprenyl-3-methyl-5-hydroxy-6-metoxy-1,4-benzoquinol methylase
LHERLGVKDNISQVARYWNDIAADFDTIYSGKKSRWARAMDQWLRKDMYQRFDWVMRKTGDAKGKTICDLGCGSGRFAAALAKKGARVTGVDIAPDMLKLATQLAQQEGVADSCQFVHSDLLDWKTEETYDTSIAIGFWDYIADPRGRLQVIRKVTRNTFLSAWPRMLTWRMPVRKLRLAAAGCPVYFFRRGQVFRMLQEAGFEVVSCEVVGKLFCVEARPV